MTDSILPVLDGESFELAPHWCAEALETVRPKLAALPADSRHPAVKTSALVFAALRVSEAYLRDRGLYAEAFSRTWFDPAAYDDLTVRAGALWQADWVYRLGEEARNERQELLAEAADLRRKLYRGAEYLLGDDEQSRTQLAAIGSGRSHLELVDDLVGLVNLLSPRMGEVEAETKITAADLEQASNLARRVGPMVDEQAREMAERGTRSERRELRRRAAAHLYEGMSAIRRAAQFVFHDDPDRLRDYLVGRRRESGNGSLEEDELEVVELDSDEEPGTEPRAA